MSEYQLEVFKPELINQIARLRQQIWGGSRAANVAYLNWRYLANPYLADPLIHVARHQGRVVGMRAMYGTCWVVPGLAHPHVLPCGADTGISPEHRDTGLFSDLTEFAVADVLDRGFRFAINMSATPANLVTSIMTMGWRKVGSYEPLIRLSGPLTAAVLSEATGGTPISAHPLVQQLKRSSWLANAARQTRTLRRNAFGTSPFAELDNHLRHAARDTSIEITSEPRPRLMATLAARFDDPERIHHLRDKTFFAWRYQNPLAISRLSPYRVLRRFLFLDTGDAAGYAVLQGHPGDRRVNLVDWAGDEETFSELIRVVIALVKPERLGTWGTTLPIPFKQQLDQSDFGPDESDPNARREGFIVKALVPDETKPWAIGGYRLLDIASWDLRMIESDAFM
jgi:GNAT superfamily N-acetyltransferase